MSKKISEIFPLLDQTFIFALRFQREQQLKCDRKIGIYVFPEISLKNFPLRKDKLYSLVLLVLQYLE